jgi:hypothetical protein
LTVKATVALCDNPLILPIIVTVTGPAVVKVHDRADVPASVTLLGERVHAELSADKPTVPAKLFKAVIVIVELPAALVFTVTAVGLAEIPKSTTWNTILPVGRLTVELPMVADPVTVTV